MRQRITATILREKIKILNADGSDYELDSNQQGYRLTNKLESCDLSDRMSASEMWYFLSGMQLYKETNPTT